MVKSSLPSPELLRQLLRYNRRTGLFFWRTRPLSMFKSASVGAAWNTKHAGKEAFTNTNGHGYKTGGILGKSVAAHRVAVAMVTGEWPVCVDHRNKKTADNRWANLKPGTQGDNRKNQKLKRNNSSGVCGVHWDKRRAKWVAKIGLGEYRHRHLGYFSELKDAKVARKLAEKELGYSHRHGVNSAPL